MRLEIAAILFSLLMMSSLACARTATVIDLTTSGDAHYAITDAQPITVDGIDLRASYDGISTFTVSGGYSSLEEENLSDYTLKVDSDGSSATVTLRATGELVDALITELGEFDIKSQTSSSGNRVSVSLNASLGVFFIENIIGLNPYDMLTDIESQKANLQAAVDSILSQMPIQNKPALTVESYTFDWGADSFVLTLSLYSDDWKGLLPEIMGTSAESALMSESGFSECLSIPNENLLNQITSNDFTVSANLKAASNGLVMDISGSLAAAGEQTGESLSAEMKKSGPSTSVQASLVMPAAQNWMPCIVKSYLPGDYSVGAFTYSTSKVDGSTVVESIEGDLTSFAKKSGEKYSVTFPSSLTATTDITVNIPSGMSIISVLGGQKISSQSATSTPSEEFVVTYGQPGGDMTIWIIAAVVVVLLIFLLTRKKK